MEVPESPSPVSENGDTCQSERRALSERSALRIVEANCPDHGEHEDWRLGKYWNHSVPSPADHAILGQHARHVVLALLCVQPLSACTEDNDLFIEKSYDSLEIVGAEPELKLGQDAARDLIRINHCASLGQSHR
jgi:hypothetical protein